MGRSLTGQDQDTESGLYDFPTRGYSPVESRWLSPDKAGVAAAHPEDPQSWNRYAYVHNKPLRSIDFLGQDVSNLYLCDPCDSPDDSSSDDSGGDSIGDVIVNAFGDIGNAFADCFGLCGGGGGSSTPPPPPPPKLYAQSGVLSDSAKAVQSALGSGSSVSVTNNPGIPSPANNMFMRKPDFYSLGGTVGFFSQSLNYVPSGNHLYYSPGLGAGEGVALTAGWMLNRTSDPNSFTSGWSGNVCGFNGVGGCIGSTLSGDVAFQLGIGVGGFGRSAGYGVDLIGLPPPVDPLATVPAGGLYWEDETKVW